MVRVLTAAVATAGGLTAWLLARSARRSSATARARQIHDAPRFRLPALVRRPLQRRLTDAGAELDPEAALGWWGLGGACAVVLGAAVGPVTAVLAAAGTLGSVPLLLATGRARVQHRLDLAVPELLERVAGELRSGGTVGLAVADSSSESPLQLGEITRRVALGAAFRDALATWSERLDRRDVRAAAGALGLAATVGGRAAGALDGLAESLRARLAALDDARALAAQARLSAVVVGAAPMGFVAFSALIDPGALQSLVGTGTGRVCLVVGLGLELAAAVWMRRILRSEP